MASLAGLLDFSRVFPLLALAIPLLLALDRRRLPWAARVLDLFRNR